MLGIGYAPESEPRTHLVLTKKLLSKELAIISLSNHPPSVKKNGALGSECVIPYYIKF